MAEKTVFSVTQLNKYVKDLLENDELLYLVSVRGEISNFNDHLRTGNYYFSLKDDGGVLKGVMFSNFKNKLNFKPENGMKVVITGRITVYVRDGSYQIQAYTMEPDGIGSLYLAFEQLKKNLEAKGYFDPAHKKPIPKFPQTVGIITSPTGAAIRDMINVATRRFLPAKLVLFPCLVQGEGAPAQLCSGVRFFNDRHPVDVIIIGRGGGSLEELWAFNDERLADEIFRSRVPVISAVGHETDFSISDFVADLRAPTPSAAAELCLPDGSDLVRRLASARGHLDALMRAKLDAAAARLDGLKKNRYLVSLQSVIDDRRMEIMELSRRLENGEKTILENKRLRLSGAMQRLSALDPMKIMSRGYAAVFDGETVVDSAEKLSVGSKVTLRLRDGRASAKIEEVELKKEGSPKKQTKRRTQPAPEKNEE
ncbi:MAG: exodeoxyribonuclease VII large subunit [Clostridia bacterium]|nr:exodeoxyribonuclease VII large subunit [Clostridia bacterium]